MDKNMSQPTSSSCIPTNIVRPVFVNNNPANSVAGLNIECRSDSNGHSSPDSGVNDMSDDRSGPARRDNSDYKPAPVPSAAAGDVNGRGLQQHAHHPPMIIQRHHHKITLVPDEMFRIKMGDTERHISGMCYDLEKPDVDKVLQSTS